MRKSFLFLLLLLGAAAWAQAQPGRTSFSVQLGYQYKLLSPKAFNYVLDSVFNTRTPRPLENFEPIRWTPGYAVGIGLNRRRFSFSLDYNQFSGTSQAIADDSLSNELNWSARLSGWNAGINFAGALIDFADNGAVYVGGGLQLTNLTTLLATDESQQADPAFEEVSSENKVSFNIALPIRYGPLPWFQLSIEPHYQVFFTPISFGPFNRRLNGPVRAAAFENGVINEMDHFGVTAKLILFLRRN
jgi:hypothetical protein